MGKWNKLIGAFIEFDEDTTGEKVTGGDLDVEDVGDLLSQLDVPSSTPESTPAAVTTPVVKVSGIQANKPFAEIHAAQGVAPATKTAEEVLAIMGGMAALTPEVRKISLDAMDMADDNWTMDDVRKDATNKKVSLGAYKAGLDVALTQSHTSMEASLQEQDTYMSEATKTIRDQIEALQAEITGCQELLQAEIVTATEVKSVIKSDHEAVVAAHASECARIDAEIARLSTI